ncbi:MAG: DUF3108 domain-containing protein [Planctomycetes bacterium]|nr:DUF3108 domain-containing protein [Planctomycetota bacterium]
MLLNIQKGSLTGLNKPEVSAAFFVLSFFLVNICSLFTLGELHEWGIRHAECGVQAGQGHYTLMGLSELVEARGCKLNYNIGFWIFPKIGVGTATIERTDKPATYTVTLEAHPLGIFASIVKRQVIYQTIMEFDKKSNKLRPLHSSQKRIKGKEVRDKTIKFDYEKGVCVFEYRKNDVLEKEKIVPIPSGIIAEDPVTAFHNLCDGAYGEINEGSIYNTKIMVKESPTNLTFEVCSKNCKREFALSENEENHFGFVAKINLAPEIVDSTKGEIFVCFSSDSIPVAVKVKDVIGFGDLYGQLVNKIIY